MREMENDNVELLCVSETHWIDSGKRTLSTGQATLYSGQTEHQHTSGVAIIMNRKAEQSPFYCKSISDRLIKARYNSMFETIDSACLLCTKRKCRGGDQGLVLRKVVG